MLWFSIGLASVAAAVLVVAIELRKKNAFIWIGAYLRKRRTSDLPSESLVHVMFCFVDHFEPKWGRPSTTVEQSRVASWCTRYSQMASRHIDADGVNPQHTFFYPEEEYEVEHLDRIAELCRQGFGEIEVHLHHDHDTADGLTAKINQFCNVLHRRHGALSRLEGDSRLRFGFIHGNWALDNSRGDGRWCGVNDEIQVLGRLGCYADFTLPSAPSDTQTRKINSIYYVTDDPKRPKSHDAGIDVESGRAASGDLMIIQGPLALNWARRKWGLMPRIENSDVRASNPPTGDRIDLWVRQHIHVKGRPDWVFIKVHTHGAQEGDMETLLGERADFMHNYLERNYNDGKKYALHYVTAREMFNIVKAAEEGCSGNPSRFRDHVIPRPEASRRTKNADITAGANGGRDS